MCVEPRVQPFIFVLGIQMILLRILNHDSSANPQVSRTVIRTFESDL